MSTEFVLMLRVYALDTVETPAPRVEVREE